MPVSKDVFLAEFSVFSQSPTLEYKGNGGGELATLVMNDIREAGPNGVAFGWGPEADYVSTLSKNAIYVHASDYCTDLAELSNLHVLSSMDRVQRAQLPVPLSPPPLHGGARVHTVAFLMSDGDNLQWLLGPWGTDPRWFGAYNRGDVAIGWTLSPAALRLAPPFFQHVMANAHANDSFVAAPSGVGYTFPSTYANKAEFADLTTRAMNNSGLRILNVIDTEFTTEGLAEMAANPQIDAFLLYPFGDCYSSAGRTAWLHGKPAIGGRISLWGQSKAGCNDCTCQDVDAVVQHIKTHMQSYASSTVLSSPDAYSLIPVHAWTHSYADVVRAAQLLTAQGDIEVVTPAALVQRFIDNVKPSHAPH